MKLLLCGDVCPTALTDPDFAAGNVSALFSDVATLFAGNDVNMVNLECALTDKETPIKKIGPNLKASVGTAATLRALGVTHCGLSNNHSFDYGRAGVKDMLAALQKNGITYTGFGDNYADSRKNLVIERNGSRVTVIAVCEHEYTYAMEDAMGARPFDEFDTIEDIRAAKAQGGRVVVLYHGGKELCRYPSPRLVRVCRAMVRSGADVVLCQHSHCIGCYEKYAGSHILYGQGNFHFVGRGDDDCWHSGLSVRYDSATHGIEFIPHVMTEHGIALATGQEKDRIMADFAARNQSLTDGTWLEGWRDFCEKMRPKYEKAVAEGGVGEDADSLAKHNHKFAHYLDCEAHTDVWRELYKTAHHTNEK